MNTFMNLKELARSFQTDKTTQEHPVQRMFICDGEFLTANLATSGAGNGSKLHTQPDHDEIVIVIEGAALFRVGKDVHEVSEGDFIFIPRNTLHGRVEVIREPMTALSIYAPFFDRSKDNIKWEK